VNTLTFVDTNILVYSHDTHDEVKHRVAQDLLAQLWTSGPGALSSQVLQEFYNVATRKLQPPMSPPQARQVVHDYSDWCVVDTDPVLIISASRLIEAHSINFWDALIVEAAVRAGATELVTEDLQHGRRFGELQIRNPFPLH
jgi:predicted nucleic acid-binding protein